MSKLGAEKSSAKGWTKRTHDGIFLRIEWLFLVDAAWKHVSKEGHSIFKIFGVRFDALLSGRAKFGVEQITCRPDKSASKMAKP